MTLLLVTYATYQMLQSMLMVIGTWILLAILFIGLGSLLRSLLNLKRESDHRDSPGQNSDETIRDLFSLFWVGFAFLLLLLLAWNMFFPVSFVAVWFVSILSLCGLFSELRKSGTIWKIQGPILLYFLILFVFALWLSNRAIGPNGHHDAGLYHLNQIRWAAEYAVVPGLGNLHSRLGFPSAYPLLFAFIHSVWSGKASHICNGLLLFFFAAQVQWSAFRILLHRQIQMHDVLPVFLGIPLALHCLLNVSDTSTDLPLVLLSFVITSHLCQVLAIARGRLWDVFFISTIAAAGIVCKSNFLVFGVVAISIVISRTHVRSQYALYIPAICLLALWIVRSSFLTGYPFYPIPVAGLPADWRVPEKYVELLLQSIQNYGRLPESNAAEILSIWDWLPVWTSRLFISFWNRFFIVLPAAILIAGVILSFFRKALFPFSVMLRITAPSLAGIAFWLYASPEARFVAGSMWCLAGVILVRSIGSSDGTINRTYAVTLLVTVLITCPSLFFLLNKQVLLSPGSDGGFHPVRRVELTKYKTESGLILYVPVKGDQCWDSRLPCTPYPDPELRLRSQGNLQKGFAVSR